MPKTISQTHTVDALSAMPIIEMKAFGLVMVGVISLSLMLLNII